MPVDNKQNLWLQEQGQLTFVDVLQRAKQNDASPLPEPERTLV